MTVRLNLLFIDPTQFERASVLLQSHILAVLVFRLSSKCYYPAPHCFFNLFCGRGGQAFSSEMQEIGFQPPRLFVACVNALQAIPAALSALLAITFALNASRAILAALSLLRAIALPASRAIPALSASQAIPATLSVLQAASFSPRCGRYQPLSPLVSACQLLREGSSGDRLRPLRLAPLTCCSAYLHPLRRMSHPRRAVDARWRAPQPGSRLRPAHGHCSAGYV